jgi:single-stranded-DNA-specific exonuclease
MKFIPRETPPRAAWALQEAGTHPLLARLLASRGIRQLEQMDDSPAKLLPPADLLGAVEAARLLADAITQGQRLCIVADYDCDGAWACAACACWAPALIRSATSCPTVLCTATA